MNDLFWVSEKQQFWLSRPEIIDDSVSNGYLICVPSVQAEITSEPNG